MMLLQVASAFDVKRIVPVAAFERSAATKMEIVKSHSAHSTEEEEESMSLIIHNPITQ